MPGDGDPENGETFQVGGDTPGWGRWNLNMAQGSLVCPFFVSLLDQEVTVKDGSLGFGTQQAMPCDGGFLTFLRCGIGNRPVHRSWSFMIFAGLGERARKYR